MVAAGKLDLAQESLHRQFGIVNFEPLRPVFMRILSSCHGAVAAVPNAVDMAMGIRRDAKEKKEYMAAVAVSMGQCQEMLQTAFERVTSAAFEEAIGILRSVLHTVPLLVISSSDQLKDARNLVAQCSQYINALRVKLAANSCGDGEKQRQFELNCFFTHFELQDAHIFSGLYGAMKLGYKAQYFGTTAVLCRRLLELAVSGRVRKDASQKYIAQVQKVLAKCEKKAAQSAAKEEALDYKPHDFTALCCQSLRPIERNEETVKSPYCGSLFKAEFNGQLSPVCNLVRIGGSNQGLTINTK